jgi:hypothetical protein
MSNTPTTRTPHLLLAALLVVTACGSDDGRTLRIIKGAAALRDGVITGFVIDDETEQPVRAEIVVNDTPVRARSDGTFEVPTTAGRVRVEVRADGYLKTFRDVAVGGKSLPMPFKVARRAPKQVVGAAGGRLTYREATLEIPAGAFGTDVGVSLTHLSRVRVAAIAATPQFIDDQGIPRRAVALVDLTADDTPTMAVRARVPVPADATMDTLSGYVIDANGSWTTPITPDSVSGGFAEFLFTGDMQIGVAIDARNADGKRIGYLVAERGDTGSGQGDVLGTGDLTVGMRAAAIIDPQGSRVELAPGTRARVEVPPETPLPSRAPYAGTVGVSAGRARVVVPPPVADAPKLIKLTIKGNAGQFDVKGTAFGVTTCGVVPNVIDVVEVGEGVVGATAGKDSKDVSAGESAAICTNCSPAAIAMCTPVEGDGGLPPDEDDGGSITPDAGAPDTAVIVGADAGVGPDTALAPDSPAVTPDAPALPPDAALPADAPLTPDLALPPDQAPLPPDAAPLPPDSAPLPPDAAVLPPDAAPLPPDAAPPPPDMMVPMDATAAMFALSPGSQDFGSVTIGVTSAAVNFTVTNLGDMTSGVPGVSVTGDFVVSTNGCINAVPSNTSCVIGVAFQPTVAGGRSGVLSVTTSGGLVSLANLTGTGVSPAPAQFAIKPLTFNFGWKQQGAATGDIVFTLTNTGGQSSSVPAISIGGNDKADFAFNAAALKNGICTVPLAPGGSCTIPVHFAPKTAMVSMTTGKAGTLDIVGNPGGAVSATLAGDATVANGLVLLPPTHDFGTVAVGQQSARFTYVLSNPSTTATVSQLAFAQVGTGIYAIVLPPPVFQLIDATDCNTTHQGQLGPGQSCNLIFVFNSQSIGTKQLMWQATGQIPGIVPITATATAHVQGTGM